MIVASKSTKKYRFTALWDINQIGAGKYGTAKAFIGTPFYVFFGGSYEELPEMPV